MNIRSIAYIMGWILRIESAFMLLPIVTAVIYGETQGWAFVAAMALALISGYLLTWKKPKNLSFYMKEGLVTTALCWVVMSIFGCLPFVMTGEIPRFIDALFEIVSGFTTTGASILPEVESMSHCSMLWRCFTHWIGGMGVLVFLLAVLPLVGGSNMNLMKAESPGPSVSKLVPKIRHTARILYLMYFVMTATQMILLLLGGMIPFEAVCTAFGTAGTGGFGFRNDSFASFSPYIQWVVTIFMVLFGVNFNVYYYMMLRKFRTALRCEEMRWYLAIITAATLLICANIYDLSLTLEHNLRNAAFQVASVITTTGFGTVDFDLWPTFSKLILIMLMFCGACAGSTGGGLKVSRMVMAGKSVGRFVGSCLHPRAVGKIRFEDKEVDSETMYSIFVYFFAAFIIFCVSVLLVSLDGMDLISTFTAVTATFNNIGPGLGAVGPTSNFGALSDLSKVVLILDMLIGRLEIFPMLILVYPPLWKETLSISGKKARMRARAQK